MRHTRARRRFKAILSFLLAICAILFIENRIEAFVPQLKCLAAAKIEDTLAGRIKLSIGNLGGGILNPLTLNDIKIIDKAGALVFSSIDINTIRTNYRIWDLFLKKDSQSVVAGLLSKDSVVYINFMTRNDAISGFVKLEGDLENSIVLGCLNLPGKKRVDFTGSVRGDSFNIELRPDKGYVRAEGRILANGELVMDFKLEHLMLYGSDIVCEGVFKASASGPSAGQERGNLECELETKNFMLNYRQFLNLAASCRITDGVLEVTNLSAGDSFTLAGKASLKKPHAVDMMLTANNVSLTWLLIALGAPDATAIITGTMNGRFRFKGPLHNIKSDIYLEVRKGTLSTLNFDYLNAAMKGDGPVLRIEDSRVTREGGYFVLAGEIDLRRMGKNNLFSDLKVASDEKAIDWDGCDTSKWQDVYELRMEKRLNDNFKVGFKKIITDEKIDESSRHNDEVQLEYMLHPTESLRFMVGHDQDFFGFEHKDKF